MIPIEIMIKPAKDCENEKPFIYNSWLKSFGKTSEARRMVSKIYFENYTRIIDQIFENDAYVAIAVSPDDVDLIFGYIVFHWDTDINLTFLHYVYVKEAFRDLKIAKRLLEQIHVGIGSEPIICTFANEKFDDLRDKFLLTYNPFMRS